MENYNLHRRAQSGWHPTTYSRPVDKKPERNWAALMEAAKRKPVGYWEDAPRGMRFNKPRQVTATFTPGTDYSAAPVSSDVYIVGALACGVLHGGNAGSAYYKGGGATTHFDVQAVAEEWRTVTTRDKDYSIGTQTQFIAKLREWNHPALAEFEAQPRKRVEGRVWKGAGAGHYARIGERMFFKMNAWREYFDIWDAKGQRPTGAFDTGELHGPEADAIIRECASAMGVQHG